MLEQMTKALEDGERIEVRGLCHGDRHARLRRRDRRHRPVARDRPHHGRDEHVRDVARRIVAFERAVEAVGHRIVRDRPRQNRRVKHRRGIVHQLRARVADRVRQPVRQPAPQADLETLIGRRADVVAIQADRRVLGVRLEQLRDRNRRIAERR